MIGRTQCRLTTENKGRPPSHCKVAIAQAISSRLNYLPTSRQQTTGKPDALDLKGSLELPALIGLKLQVLVNVFLQAPTLTGVSCELGP